MKTPITATLLLAFAIPAFAQRPDLDDLAKILSTEIEKARFKSVVVADFVSKEGDSSSQGQYLARKLSQQLEKHKKHFVVLKQDRLSEALRQSQLAPKDLTVLDSLQRIGNSLQVDAFVTGTLEIAPSQYALTVAVRNAKDGIILGSSEKSISRPSFLDTLDPAISYPTCQYCPEPTYTSTSVK